MNGASKFLRERWWLRCCITYQRVHDFKHQKYWSKDISYLLKYLSHLYPFIYLKTYLPPNESRMKIETPIDITKEWLGAPTKPCHFHTGIPVPRWVGSGAQQKSFSWENREGWFDRILISVMAMVPTFGVPQHLGVKQWNIFFWGHLTRLSVAYVHKLVHGMMWFPWLGRSTMGYFWSKLHANRTWIIREIRKQRTRMPAYPHKVTWTHETPNEKQTLQLQLKLLEP